MRSFDQRAIVGLLTVVAACGVPGDPAAPPPVSAGRLASGSVASAPGAITLITGDRITLHSVAGRSVPVIEPGPGRAAIAFAIERDGDDITVLPDDVAALVAAGQLDRGLFEVSRLLAGGYGDDRRDDVPLILGGPDLPATQRRMAATPSAGVTTGRAMPGLHAMAIRQRKASGGAALAARAPGTKIWLDRKRHVVLDRSVPQIGAPAAYARGLTGAGVTVAVIDTGVDASHPDFAGKLLASESFVADGLGTSDVIGHGTHVASIVAGSGAASAGRFHGVAPGATLVSGRVCDQFGDCFDSDILAGIEWAVMTEHAPIVNLSLGAPDEPSIDPLEDAVNQLSAQSGTLFVVAAGNSGFTPQSVESPGSADAALTVGAVGRTDQRASFSGQGPRIGDHAIKPDITAPGVGIVAARAAGSTLGTPVDAFYMQLTGTSMATPHVAGAAAILLQQHPGWTGAQLKAALVGAANPNPGLTVYQQGGGRVDVDRVTRQTVTADPASLSLGIARFPHDDDPPIVRTVHYTNTGAAAVALSLTAALTAPDGSAAPSGMVAIAPATLSVPAGGSADAVVTVDTRGSALDGVYGGTLTAIGDDVRIVTPLGVDREVESHDLTLRIVDRDGAPGSALVEIGGVGAPGDPDRQVELIQVVSDRATLRLPVGAYTVVGLGSDAFEVAPHVAFVADSELVLDARVARPVDVTLPQSGLTVAHVLWDFEDDVRLRSFATFVPRSLPSAELGDPAPPGQVHSNVRATLIPDGETEPTSIYELAHTQLDHMMTGWQQTLGPRDLATVDARHAGSDDQHFTKITAAIPVANSGFFAGFGFGYQGGFRRTEHYYGPGFQWFVGLDQDIPFPGFPGVFQPIATLDTLPAQQPGTRTVETWNQAPYGPAFAGPTLDSADRTGAPERTGDQLVIMPSLFSDQAVPARMSSSLLDSQRLALSRDGRVVAEVDDALSPEFLFVTVPPEAADFRLEHHATRPAASFALSTEVSAAWTFRSQHVDGAPLALPLPALRFFPELDEHNQSAARIAVLPIRIERPAGAATPAIASASVDVSFDDGATWFPVPLVRVGDRALGVVIHPRGARFVSLRGRASDVDGNTVDQTIVRAYALVAR